jgi:hypothetical protein
MSCIEGVICPVAREGWRLLAVSKIGAAGVIFFWSFPGKALRSVKTAGWGTARYVRRAVETLSECVCGRPYRRLALNLQGRVSFPTP